jgi:hypothetical protein
MQEKNLYQIWESRKTPFVLYSTGGYPVIIHSTGHYNRYDGPDYLNCKIEIAGEIRKGSIEIHLSSSDWFSHQHHIQHQYTDIILHVVFRNDLPAEKLQLIPAPTVMLQGIDSASSSADLRPILFSRSLSRQRLFEKVAAYQSLLRRESMQDLFYSSIFKACGYPINQHSFARVYQIFHKSQSPFMRALKEMDPTTGTALFLLLAGNNLLTPSLYRRLVQILSHSGHLSLLSTFHVPSFPAIRFRIGKVHPSNHPLIKLEQLYRFFRHAYKNLHPLALASDLLQSSVSFTTLHRYFLIPDHEKQLLDPGKKYVLSSNRIREWLVTDFIPLLLASSCVHYPDELLDLYFRIPAGYRPSYLPDISYAWQLQAFKAYQKRNEKSIPEY